MIDKFYGEYFFLSNFYTVPVMYEGLLYQNSEAAFQSAKTTDMGARKEFCNLRPSNAKWLGRRIIIRPDWEKIKDDVMYQCVRNKFFNNIELGKRLVDTGNHMLIEGNTWNDTYWGMCEGYGKNKLGKILMKVRNELKETYSMLLNGIESEEWNYG